MALEHDQLLRRRAIALELDRVLREEGVRALDAHLFSVLEEGDDGELLRVSGQIGIGLGQLPVQVLRESETIVVCRFGGSILARFVCLQLSVVEVVGDVDNRVIDFVTRLYNLKGYVAITNVRIVDTLDVAALNFVKWYNLVVLSVVIFHEIVYIILACHLSEFTLFKVSKEEKFLFFVRIKYLLALCLVILV